MFVKCAKTIKYKVTYILLCAQVLLMLPTLPESTRWRQAPRTSPGMSQRTMEAPSWVTGSRGRRWTANTGPESTEPSSTLSRWRWLAWWRAWPTSSGSVLRIWLAPGPSVIRPIALSPWMKSVSAIPKENFKEKAHIFLSVASDFLVWSTSF